MSSTTMPLKKRIFTIVAGLAFLGFMGSQIQSMVVQGMRETEQQEQQASQVLQQLQKQEDGYEKVLKREPNNEAALQGLAQARLDMKDYKGAIEPLKKLIELNPQQEHYKQLLAKLQQKINQTNEDS